MAVTAAAYVGAAVIAATAAFIGVVIGKEQKTTEFRQDWINAQRNDIATVLAKVVNAKGLSGEHFPGALLAFDEAFNRIRLRENPIYFYPDELTGHVERRYHPGSLMLPHP